jgi:hypothetical protein
VAKVAIGFGAALILLALVGYFGASGPTDGGTTTYRSWTALIPAFAGVPLVICGLIALNPAYRKHAMHAAAVFALLGFLAPLGRLLPQLARGNTPRPLVFVSQAGMSILCLVFLILCVRSFIAARRAP